jgi:hypothetical protein
VEGGVHTEIHKIFNFNLTLHGLCAISAATDKFASIKSQVYTNRITDYVCPKFRCSILILHKMMLLVCHISTLKTNSFLFYNVGFTVTLFHSWRCNNCWIYLMSFFFFWATASGMKTKNLSTICRLRGCKL